MSILRTPPPFGPLTEALIDTLDELISNLAALAELVNQNRIEYVRPSLDVLNEARARLNQGAKNALSATPATELLEFERLLRQSLVFEEVAAFNSILAAPDDVFSLGEKLGSGETVAGSVKSFLKILIEKYKGVWGMGWFAELLEVLMEVIDEILDFLRGRRGS
jgi:hypothetical protein